MRPSENVDRESRKDCLARAREYESAALASYQPHDHQYRNLMAMANWWRCKAASARNP